MYRYITRAEDLEQVANEISQADVVGLDLETTSYSPRSGQVRLCSVATPSSSFVIDVRATGGLHSVGAALSRPTLRTLGANLKFDQRFLLAQFGVELANPFDVFRASYMLHNGEQLPGTRLPDEDQLEFFDEPDPPTKTGHNLYDLYQRELGLPPGLDLGGSDWSLNELSKSQLDYAGDDIQHLFELRDKLAPQCAEAGLDRVLAIEFGAILPEAAMENNGFRLDGDMWLELAADNRAKAKRLRDELCAELPKPHDQLSLLGVEPGFNLDSTKQVLKSLQKLGADISNTKKTTLALLAAQFPLIKKFMEYRVCAKQVDAFGQDYLKYIDPGTGRIHTDYWPLTACGRYSSRNPNCQQLPRDKRFRKCFKPLPGRRLIMADYSQVELRIVAELSGDRIMTECYDRGEDIHQRTASIVSGVPMERVTKEQRQQAKPLNFGLIYSLGENGLILYAATGYGVFLTRQQARRIRRAWFKAYRGVEAWQEHQLEYSLECQIARTVAGRLRYMRPDFHGEWMNTPVQGTGADALKASLALTYQFLLPYGRKAQLVHMVHDELIVECDDDPQLCEEIKAGLERCMLAGIAPMMKRIPVVCEGVIASSWADKG